MNKQLYQFFTDDHRRLEALLTLATQNIQNVDMEAYNTFRTGLLTHIKMEEKILFPAAQKANAGVPLPIFARLRLEHGAITSLMVPPPTASLIKALWHILEKHDLAEEEPGGMYEVCEALTTNETASLLTALANISAVPVHPVNTAPYALDASKRALARAGYDYDAIAS